MKTSQHPCPNIPGLQQFLLGLLSSDDLHHIEQHLLECSVCLEAMAALNASDQVTKAVQGCVQAGPRRRDEWEDALMGKMIALKTVMEQNLNDTIADTEIVARSLPGYDIFDTLGRGGAGVVYRAQHRALGRIVALKMLRWEGDEDPIQRARFLSEARMVASLRHPHIVQIYDVGEHEGRSFFSMEYLQGGSLAEKLRGKPLAGRQATQLVESLARAVQQAHDTGIVHRDLKPANVLLDATGSAKIADFGLAKWMQGGSSAAQTQSGAILGTPSYMAPEQALGISSAIGPGTDLYALGAILYECLTGRPPFLAATLLETLDQVRYQEPPAPSQLQPGIPRDLETICLKCLEKSRYRRYASAEALADDLRRYQCGEPILARPAGPVEVVLKWARRKPTAAILTVVTTLFLVAILGGGVLHYTRLKSALHRAEQSEARTRAQYKEATETIRLMFEKTTDPRTSMIPQLSELQESQSAAALKFFEQAVAVSGGTLAEAKRDLALFSNQAATYQHYLGRSAESEQNALKAQSLLEEVIAENPLDYEARSGYAYSHVLLGSIRNSQGRWDEAEEFLRRGVGLSESLCRDAPKELLYKTRLREAYHNLGNVMVYTRRPAVEWYLKSVALSQELLRQHPRNFGYRLSVSDTYSNLWQAYHVAGQPEKALDALREASTLLDALVKEDPSNKKLGYSLGAVLIKLGATCLMQDQVEDALKEYNRSVEVLERTLKLEPNDLGTRRFLLTAQGSKAECLTKLKRYAEARTEWDKYIKLPDAMGNLDFRLQRAFTLIHTNDIAQGRSEIEAISLQGKDNGTLLYNCACVMALSVQLAASQPDNQDVHAAKAVALLEAARSAGYFKNAANIASMKKDSDLDSIRGRKDFATFVRSLE